MDKHQKYRLEILDKYHEDKGGIIEGYPDPTLSDIRDACELLFKTNIKKSDKAFLKSFLGVRNDLMSPDHFYGNNHRYKKIQRFLRGESKKPQGSNTIEIIAWLINFEPRPLSSYVFGIADIQIDLKEPVPDKINQILTAIKQLEQISVSIEDGSFQNFAEISLGKAMQTAIKKWGDEDLKPILNNVIDEKVVALEKRYKKAMINEKRLGFLTAVLVPMTLIDKVKEDIILDTLEILSDIYNYDFVIDENDDLYIEDDMDDELLDGLT